MYFINIFDLFSECVCVYIYIYIYIYIYELLATVVEGAQKAPFSIATTPRCRGGCYSFPWIAPLYPRYVKLTGSSA